MSETLTSTEWAKLARWWDDVWQTPRTEEKHKRNLREVVNGILALRALLAAAAPVPEVDAGLVEVLGDEDLRETLTLVLWDEGVIRPEHLGRLAVDTLLGADGNLARAVQGYVNAARRDAFLAGLDEARRGPGQPL